MTQRFRRLISSIILGLMLAIVLAGCTITAPALPVAPTNASPTRNSADTFAGQLMLALIERDYTTLQQMMGNPFALGYWQSEGVSYPPGIAIADLRSNYLPPGAAPAFDTTTDLTTLLDGVDPLGLWGPDVNAVKAIYVTSLGPERRDEAILIIALDQNEQPYWHGMLAAPGGFVRTTPATALPSTATPTTPPPNTGVYPTEVRLIQVLQNVNVRNGPGTQFDRIGRYVAGQVVDVFGANINATWWNVRCPNGSVGNCWVTADRDTTQPATQPGPTPTPTPLPPPGSPIRIQFPPGGTSATVSGSVQFPDRPQYVLRALTGQEMTVEIFSPGGQANFAIQGVSDGQPYKRLENESRSFTFRLPTTQDYLISVATPGGATNYDLRVTVVTARPLPAEPIRIQFPPGGTSATVEGVVQPLQMIDYALRAQAGQEMTVQISSPRGAANFAITGLSDGQAYKRLVNKDRYYSFRLPITQDYVITVATGAGVVDYSLTVTVVTPGPPPPPGDPIRIRFEPGATSASVSGNLFSGDRQEYLVRALAGQEMTVELYGETEDTLLAIRGADGTVYKRGEIGGPFFSFTLPATQDYILTVVAAGGGTSYTMVVTIV